MSRKKQVLQEEFTDADGFEAHLAKDGLKGEIGLVVPPNFPAEPGHGLSLSRRDPKFHYGWLVATANEKGCSVLLDTGFRLATGPDPQPVLDARLQGFALTH